MTKILNALVSNTKKALNNFSREQKDDTQAEIVENFVKDLIMDLNNILTKFFRLKERKQKRQEDMAPEQVNGIVNFIHFVKSLSIKVHLASRYFQKRPTFAEKIDKEIKEMEIRIKADLKKINKALEETPDTLAIRFDKYTNTLIETVRESFIRHRFGILKPKQLTHTEQAEGQLYNNKEEISAFVANSPDREIENLVYSLSEASKEHKDIKQK